MLALMCARTPTGLLCASCMLRALLASQGNSPAKPVGQCADRAPVSNMRATFFPDMPVGQGLDTALSYTNRFVAHSSQTIVQLSPFIIPLMLAFGWHFTKWFGLGVPLLVLLPVFGALINAEHTLADRTLLPEPGERLNVVSNGKPVRLQTHSVAFCARA